MVTSDNSKENIMVNRDTSEENIGEKSYISKENIKVTSDTSKENVMVKSDTSKSPKESSTMDINIKRCRYPYCIVWSPIPVLTWFFPFIGHMGICTSTGVKRDFASSYRVTEDLMAFGRPTKYWQLDQRKISANMSWDTAVREACDIYNTRQHIIYYDNCHSHVGKALSIMNYNGSKNWNMMKLALYFSWNSKFTNLNGFLRTWVPFFILLSIVVVIAMVIVTLIINTENFIFESKQNYSDTT